MKGGALDGERAHGLFGDFLPSFVGARVEFRTNAQAGLCGCVGDQVHDSRAGEPWIDVSPTRRARKVLNGLVPGSMYQVRVRALPLGGRSDFGNAVSFMVA